MRALDAFIVDLPKNINDSITTKGGMELYIDTRFEGSEFKHRVTGGEVVATPAKIKSPVSVGDTIYFHHLVVMEKNQIMPGTKDKYMVFYNKHRAVNNQAIAYKSKETGEVFPLDQWALLEEYKEPEELKSDVIELVTLKEPQVTKGIVSFRVDALDLNKGSVVGFKKNRDYRIEIDGKEYYRVAIDELLYQEVQDS